MTLFPLCGFEFCSSVKKKQREKKSMGLILTTSLIPSSVNPFGKQHGAPEDVERHVGDLGNIKTDSNGNAKGTLHDDKVMLIGEHSVLGVSITTLHHQEITSLPLLLVKAQRSSSKPF
jgi:hypothetical protein